MHIDTPGPHQLRRLFPVCITVLWVLGSYTDRQLLQYPADRAVIQTWGKVVSIDDDGVVLRKQSINQACTFGSLEINI